MSSARLRVSHASASIDASNVTGALRMVPDGSVYRAWYRPDGRRRTEPKPRLAGFLATCRLPPYSHEYEVRHHVALDELLTCSDARRGATFAAVPYSCEYLRAIAVPLRG